MGCILTASLTENGLIDLWSWCLSATVLFLFCISHLSSSRDHYLGSSRVSFVGTSIFILLPISRRAGLVFSPSCGVFRVFKRPRYKSSFAFKHRFIIPFSLHSCFGSSIRLTIAWT
ncbi:hypothetical protein Hamer_G020968 [Homarus americanus]|uniref:Uncharacterized protein n=1 Tax=Homarus americanus TaxID=6706 RepID=A0A8J5NB07_HOMAM|nr:hypothetical protein Hamer_G020968 [Homarus americanus]